MDKPIQYCHCKILGKKGVQLPINPSISFTLSNSFTETSLQLKEKKKRDTLDVDFFFEGKKSEEFEQRIKKYLQSIKSDFSYLEHHHLEIHSKNTFPHSAGIASSAASMSALALCLHSLQTEINDRDFYPKVSSCARLGSGSACRSVYGGFTLWGETDSLKESSNNMAVPLPIEVADVFSQLQDSILIVESGQKKISSSQGHQLMENHPYKNARIEQANSNIALLLKALKEGDFNAFADICEEEALSLHSMMMSSKPSFVLMTQNSLEIIRRVHTFREKSGLDITFTLDAGPNVHLIYPLKVKEEVVDFINDELLEFCENKQWIDDELGAGPELIELRNE